MINGKEESKTVYHYCSLEALTSIFKTGRLWLSDLEESNDPTERKVFCTLYFEWLRQNHGSLSSDLVMKEYEKDIRRKRFYGACFTYNEDTLLNWFGYAREGVSIGFDQEKLKGWANRITLLQNQAKRGDVRYPKGRVELFDLFEEIFKSAECAFNSLDSVEEMSLFTKSYLWKEEKEFRICVNNFVDSDDYGNSLPIVFFDGAPCKLACKKAHYEVPGILDCIKSITIGYSCKIEPRALEAKLRGIQPDFDFGQLDIRRSRFGKRIDELYSSPSLKK